MRSPQFGQKVVSRCCHRVRQWVSLAPDEGPRDRRHGGRRRHLPLESGRRGRRGLRGGPGPLHGGDERGRARRVRRRGDRGRADGLPRRGRRPLVLLARPRRLDERVEFVVQTHWTEYTELLEQGCDAALFVGQHARAGSERGVMSHTVSSTQWQNVRFNGALVGEVGINAALCGTWGCPVALVTGDDAVCEEARALLGTGLWTAPVKQALGRFAARHLSPARARAEIETAAAEAIAARAGAPSTTRARRARSRSTSPRPTTPSRTAAARASSSRTRARSRSPRPPGGRPGARCTCKQSPVSGHARLAHHPPPAWSARRWPAAPPRRSPRAPAAAAAAPPHPPRRRRRRRRGLRRADRRPRDQARRRTA